MNSKLTLLLVILGLTCCSKNDDPDGQNKFRFSGTLNVDGLPRTYVVNLPPTYYSSDNFSLVIAMHGGGGSGSQFESTSKLTEKADASGFIVVYPDGVKSAGPLGARTWNAGKCCSYAVAQNINDVKFISMLIDELEATYKINANHVYATGHSNGGMLSYRLGCELSDKIAAIATNGCSMVVTQDCEPIRPVPVLHMHSVLDENVPYTGGVGVGSTGVYFAPIDSVLNVWSTNNECLTKAEVLLSNDDYTFKRWSDCGSEATIDYYLTQDGGHGWPGGLPGGPNSDTPSVVINANDLLWEFFQQSELP